MTPVWSDLVARARGLQLHLLGRQDFESLAQSTSIADLSHALARRGMATGETGVISPDTIERAAQRAAAHRLAVLARWAGNRRAALAIVFEDETRRSLRQLLRGAVQGASPDDRLAGLVPTPDLPLRALRTLAQLETPAAIQGTLAAWSSPYAEELRPWVTSDPPDLLRLESAVNRVFFARAVRGARRGGRYLRNSLRRLIDIENAWTARLLAAHGGDIQPEEVFIEGGREITGETFERVAGAGGDGSARDALISALGRSTLVPLLDTDLVHLETLTLTGLIREHERVARTEPLSPAPVLAVALRIRAELLDLRRVAWGVALAMPAGAMTADLLSVA